ncbi:MAG: hypothetical protein ABI197_09680 [Granulicella sp.]
MMRAAYVLERQIAGHELRQEQGWMNEINFFEKRSLEEGSMEQRVMDLKAENERLQRIVAELLMRNQELREVVKA